MTPSDKLREIAVKWCPWSEKTSFKRNGKDYVPFDQMVSDLTALISEHYIDKDIHERLVERADELTTQVNESYPKEFLLWTGENCQYYPDTNEWMYFESPMTQQYFKGTDELFNYWKENEQ